MLQTIKQFISSYWNVLIGPLGFILGLVCKYFYEKITLNNKLKTTYIFEQKSAINREYSKHITPLLKSAEELNYRFWNLKNNINEKWHNIPEDEWNRDDHYYFRSFAYRLLIFLYYLSKAEISIYNLDSSLSSEKQKKYFKYIKTMKNFLCDRAIFEEINDVKSDKYHFYKDYISHYIKYISTDDNTVIDFEEFEKKMKEGYCEIKKLLLYINNITDKSNNPNYNVIKCFHLFIIKFLNSFGHDYQVTDKSKYTELLTDYKDISIKRSFVKFLERNKTLNDFKSDLKELGLSKEEIKEIILDEHKGK